MIPSLVTRLLPLCLAAAFVALSLANAQELPNADQSIPGVGGDAVLPAGAKNIVWGATPEIVQGIRLRGMEHQPTQNPHITWLIDAPLPGETDVTEVIKWKFWDGRLIEVHILYEGPFTRSEGRDLVGKFQRHYGDGKHEAIYAATSPLKQTREIAQQWWTWQDPFTIQVLKENREQKTWFVIRHSRVLEDARRAQEQRELDEARTQRVREIELD